MTRKQKATSRGKPTIIRLPVLLGIKNERPSALKRSPREVVIVAGYSWSTDRLLSSPRAIRALPEQPDGVPMSGTVLGVRSRKAPAKPRVAEIVQLILDRSASKDAGNVKGRNGAVTGAELSVRRNFRRLTAEPPHQLLESIVSKLLIADIAVFDLTDYESDKFSFGCQRSCTNQNVLLELGCALGLNAGRSEGNRRLMPVFIIVHESSSKTTPSDLGGICVHRYKLWRDSTASRDQCGQLCVEFPETLRRPLRDAIRAAQERIATSRNRIQNRSKSNPRINR